MRDPNLQKIGVYGAATALAAVLTLIITRVLWRALSPIDFGLWTLIDPMLLPAASLLLLGTDHAIVKQLRIDKLPLRVITGVLLITTLPVSAIGLLVIGIVLGMGFHLRWTNELVFTLVGESLILMMQTAFRATGAVYGFAALLLSRNLLYLMTLLAVYYREGLEISLDLTFLARGACVTIVGLLALAVLRPIPRIDWNRYRDAVRYGFPLLLTTLTYALTDMSDRWFLAEFSGVVAVGIYALHLKVAAVLSQAIVIPFGLWFPPERFKRLDDFDGGRSFFIRTATVLTVICGFLSGGIWLARNLLISLIAPGLIPSPLVLACCLGAVVCLALSQALNVGLLMPGHTSKNVISTACAVLATVVAAAVLVPFFGMNGAAISRLVGGIVLVGATAAWSHRVFPVAFPFAAMLMYFVTSAAIAFGIDCVTTAHNFSGIVIALTAWTSITVLFGMVLMRLLHAKCLGQSRSASLLD